MAQNKPADPTTGPANPLCLITVTTDNLGRAMDECKIAYDGKKLKRVQEYSLHHAVTAISGGGPLLCDTGLGALSRIAGGINRFFSGTRSISEALEKVISDCRPGIKELRDQIRTILDKSRNDIECRISREFESRSNGMTSSTASATIELLKAAVSQGSSLQRGFTPGEILDVIYGRRLPLVDLDLDPVPDWTPYDKQKLIIGHNRLRDLLSSHRVYTNANITQAQNWALTFGFRSFCRLDEITRIGILDGELVHIHSILSPPPQTDPKGTVDAPVPQAASKPEEADGKPEQTKEKQKNPGRPRKPRGEDIPEFKFSS